jgi:uncharacterized protein YjbJ (UPF0337 family)
MFTINVAVFHKRGTMMNTDQLYGQWLQFKGDLKQTWGDFTDKDLVEIGQSYDKFVGKVQERYGDRKNELMNWAAAWHRNPASVESK